MKFNATASTSDEKTDRAKLSDRTLGALFWTFSGRIVQLILRTATIVILARLLTPADFGVVAAALTVVQFSEIFALLGVGPAIVQRVQLEERHLRTGFTFSVLFGTSLSIIIWLLAPEIARFFQSAEIVPVLRVIVLVFPLSGLTVVAESLMQRELHFRKLAAIESATYAIANGLIGISLALAGFGVWALVIAYLVQEILKAFALLVAQPHAKRPQFEIDAFKELFYFGSGSTIANIFTYIGAQADNVIVGRWLGMNALGLYGRAYNLMIIPVGLFGTGLSKVLFPVMSKVQHEPEALERAYRRGTALVGLISLPLSVASCILAPELIGVLLGPSWSAAVAPFRILIIGMLFRAGFVISATVARAKGAVYRNAWRQGVYAALIAGGAWIGQNWGISGVALGVLVALAIHFLIMTQLGLNIVSFSWKQLLPVYLPCIWCTTIIGVEVWGIASMLRGVSTTPILILMVCSVVTLVTILAVIRFAPIYIIGEDGLWFVHTLLKRLPGSNSFSFIRRSNSDDRKRVNYLEY
jgi:O-antigen/teichoic acid export membrane protein